MRDYHGNTPYTQFYQHRRLYSSGYHREPQRTIGERPGRGNYSTAKYREINQVNRGRFEKTPINRGSDDKNYDKRGNDKSNKNDRGRGNEKDKRK